MTNEPSSLLLDAPPQSRFAFPFRYRNKLYWRIPGGEVQFGLISHRLTVWFRGRRLV